LRVAVTPAFASELARSLSGSPAWSKTHWSYSKTSGYGSVKRPNFQKTLVLKSQAKKGKELGPVSW